MSLPSAQMKPKIQDISLRTQFPSIDSTCVPFSFVPNPTKLCIPESRLKWKVLLSTPVTGLDASRYRRTGEPLGRKLGWTRNSGSIRGDPGGRPGRHQTAGDID